MPHLLYQDCTKLCVEWGRNNKYYDEKYKITYKDFSGAYVG